MIDYQLCGRIPPTLPLPLKGGGKENLESGMLAVSKGLVK